MNKQEQLDLLRKVIQETRYALKSTATPLIPSVGFQNLSPEDRYVMGIAVQKMEETLQAVEQSPTAEHVLLKDICSNQLVARHLADSGVVSIGDMHELEADLVSALINQCIDILRAEGLYYLFFFTNHKE